MTTKRNPSDLNSPCRELSNDGLVIIVALLVCWQIDFCRLVLDIQSSCRVHSCSSTFFVAFASIATFVPFGSICEPFVPFVPFVSRFVPQVSMMQVDDTSHRQSGILRHIKTSGQNRYLGLSIYFRLVSQNLFLPNFVSQPNPAMSLFPIQQ